MFTKVQKANALRQLLRRLDARAPINPYAVAFMLTESAFRGPLFRLAELCYSAFLIFLFRRDPKVTLGYCQVSFSYWRHRYGNNNASLFLATLSDVASYEICCSYLDSNKKSTIKEMLIHYNGRPSKLYRTLFLENLDQVRESIIQLRLASAGNRIWASACSPMLRLFADDTLSLLVRLRLAIQLTIVAALVFLAVSFLLGPRYLNASGLIFDVAGVLRLFLYEEVRENLEPFHDEEAYPHGPPSVSMRELIMPEASGPYDAHSPGLSAFYFRKRGVIYLVLGFVFQFASTLLG
jgi:hypothetical protein